jgi:hypothetical protein
MKLSSTNYIMSLKETLPRERELVEKARERLQSLASATGLEYACGQDHSETQIRGHASEIARLPPTIPMTCPMLEE